MDKTMRSNIVSRVALSVLAVLSVVLMLVGVSHLYGLYKNLADNDGSMARASLRDKKQHSVLFLSSYSQSHFSVPLQWDGISKAFEGTEVLLDTEYCSWLKGLLEEAQIPANLIKLEVTESGSFDGKWAQEFFQEVHETGMQLALDDYGTGYSTLNAVSDYPMDYIKLAKKLEIDYIQGYYYSPPLEADKAEEWLMTYQRGLPPLIGHGAGPTQ